MGARNSDVGVERGRYPPILRGVYRIFYRFLTSLACLAVRSGRSKDMEIIGMSPLVWWGFGAGPPWGESPA